MARARDDSVSKVFTILMVDQHVDREHTASRQETAPPDGSGGAASLMAVVGQQAWVNIESITSGMTV
jgi:hypothetical protein